MQTAPMQGRTERVNTPTHLAAGAMLAQFLINNRKDQSIRGRIVCGFACLMLGVASHLLLDLFPHYAWIVYLPGFEDLPFHWLIHEGVLGLLVSLPLLYFTRARWGSVTLGMVGAVYPDVEKVACVDLGMPSWMALFRWHSLTLSDRDGGLPLYVLIVAELALIAGLMLGTLAATQKRRASSRDNDALNSQKEVV